MKERPILFNGEMVRGIPKAFKQWNESRRVDLDPEKVRALFESGATAIEIATECGCSSHPVKKLLLKLGLRRPAKPRHGRGTGPNNPAWRGGHRVRKDGYAMIWTPEGERLEHRVVMERKLGRKLYACEIVHHVDGNKQNNSPDNLQTMTQREHARHHSPEMHAARYGK